ncbi:MAG: N-acetylmuramoyl-L-alanine amidase family protein, partial [Planctomycetota bacterium]
MRIQKYLIVIITLASILALVGCGESNYSPSASSKPSYSVSISQLASRLGLTVKNAGSPYYELTNANNRVLMFTYAGTTQVGGTTYVSELLIPKIRGHLITSYTPPIVTPDISPRAASGTVVIDPGHGGKDPGATSYHGYYEKTVNLRIARKLASYLENRGVRVIMTRNNDTFIELNERAEIANRAGADLFVSIHCDSHQNRSQNGYTIYVARSASWSSKKTGAAINQAMGQTGLSSVGIRNQDFRVLVRTACPAVLVECGYLTNPSEASLLDDSDFQDR